ncbi:beta-ketoacyl-[acyl-carrier-protein] synthase family protein [Opitutus sp. ER46]|uniref:beta-ketoacyl-[acyl-carrier-protein] synthase family protein n=1 Tax=Opitutus sp. ER46 TaxID=2161864 RepID=UPI000D2F880C|nr:beta-ketoacyl-[acyl-carrier-protein] synthase family protein [Opitutus sp. ER46]PTX96624.1 beta-ketoacyl synthase [Opitutus sp. ER46]
MSLPSAPRRVVVTGLGFITSIGNDRATVTRHLRELRHGLEPFDFISGSDLPVKVAGTIKEFDTRSDHYSDWRWPARYTFTRDVLRTLPPHGLHAICATDEAIADAGLVREDLARDDTGLFTASAGSPFLQHKYLGTMYDSKGDRLVPLGVVATIAGTLNFNLSTRYGMRGAVCGFVSACASTSHALGYAYDEIALGRLERVIVVGGEDITADSTYSFHAVRALSRNPDPATASRPFDTARDGFVGSGGGAALVLESAEAAQARGARIYAELAGWGQSADGYNIAISDPEGRGLALAMKRALAAARTAPTEVDYVNAHATSTVAGDRSEARALRTIFSEAGATPAISSTKALTGHALSMAGVMETAFCAVAMAEGFIPGQAHLVNPDPDCEGLNIPRETIARAPNVIVKNSSGFGGSNVSLVLRRWPA